MKKIFIIVLIELIIISTLTAATTIDKKDPWSTAPEGFIVVDSNGVKHTVLPIPRILGEGVSTYEYVGKKESNNEINKRVEEGVSEPGIIKMGYVDREFLIDWYWQLSKDPTVLGMTLVYMDNLEEITGTDELKEAIEILSADEKIRKKALDTVIPNYEKLIQDSPSGQYISSKKVEYKNPNGGILVDAVSDNPDILTSLLVYTDEVENITGTDDYESAKKILIEDESTYYKAIDTVRQNLEKEE